MRLSALQGAWGDWGIAHIWFVLLEKVMQPGFPLSAALPHPFLLNKGGFLQDDCTSSEILCQIFTSGTDSIEAFRNYQCQGCSRSTS